MVLCRRRMLDDRMIRRSSFWDSDDSDARRRSGGVAATSDLEIVLVGCTDAVLAGGPPAEGMGGRRKED